MNRLKFQKSLNSLRGWRERAFMLAIAERALPNALLYLDSIESDSPSDSPLKLADIDSAWNMLIIEQDEEGIVELLDLTQANMPDTEQSEHYGALPTHDCLSILEQALLAGINDEKPRALSVSQLSLETITQFIEFSEGDSLSENQLIKLFDSHPLIEREFSFQA
ncbi:hypothetical protein A3743_24645, partial [Oleiphilus sp. HI0072]